MEKKKTDLVVLAAGMGSRFGGCKQMASFGPHGETIIDYALYDARLAGFDRAVIIIKHAIEKDFREIVGKRIEKIMDVEYAFQEFDKVPEPFVVSPDRVKPLGTGHAILCAKELIQNPFCVVNSDDFYGRESFVLVHDYLVNEGKNCMAGYLLGNTLSEVGGVNRGVCRETPDGHLAEIVETMNITRDSGLPDDTIVSMNMWGLQTDILGLLEENFREFLATMKNPIKDEHYLPTFIDQMIHEGKMDVTVLRSHAKWHGVTYKEDTEALRAAIAAMYEAGVYPTDF
ncbi:MAG: NDP-sugar synthase [Eubacteriales bacterium]